MYVWMYKPLAKNMYTPNNQVGNMFAIGPGDRGSIWARVITKTQKIVFDASWLNTYEVRIEGKVE